MEVVHFFTFESYIQIKFHHPKPIPSCRAGNSGYMLARLSIYGTKTNCWILWIGDYHSRVVLVRSKITKKLTVVIEA